MLCDITCFLEFVGDDIYAADVKHMIWNFQNAGVIFTMGSNTGKSDVTILQHMCYAIVYVPELSLALQSLCGNGWFPKTDQHGRYLHSLFAIGKELPITY